MKLEKSILRVFDVRAKAGQAALLKQKLSDTSVKVVEGKPGNLGYFFGENLSSDGNVLVFISVWENLAAVKARFGADWEQSYLPEGYAELIESCSLRHVEFDGKLNAPNSDLQTGS